MKIKLSSVLNKSLSAIFSSVIVISAFSPLLTVGAENGIAPEELRAAFRRHEQDELAAGTPLCEGIGEALRALHAAGMRHYVATHRNLQCRELLETCGVGGLFTGFVTQEAGLPRKPAPDMLVHLMRMHRLAPDECVMIGDRPLDTLAGRAAGMRSILIDTEGRFDDASCDLRVRDVQTLLAAMVDES